MSDEVFPYIFVRSDALYDKELLKSPATLTTLCTISLFAKRKKDGSCYFKQDTIAKHLGKSRQAISKHLQTLSDLGYIKIIPQSYYGMQSNNAYKILYDTPLKFTVQGDVAAVQDDVALAVQGDVAPKPVSYKPFKKKKPLTRYSFCREINRAIKSDDIGDEFSHLTEAEIVNNTGACWDWLEMKFDILPVEGKGIFHMRAWLRKGMSLGKVSRPAKASKGEREEISLLDLPEWQQAAIANNIFTHGVFKSWIKPLEWNGNGTVFAPTRFIAETVENTYMSQLIAALHADIKIEVKQ